MADFPIDMRDVYVTLGLAVATLVLNQMGCSLERATLGALLVNHGLRLGLKAAHLDEYRVLKMSAWSAACYYFVRETYLFDNPSESDTKFVQGMRINGKSVTEEQAWDLGVVALRVVPALAASTVGNLFLLFTNY